MRLQPFRHLPSTARRLGAILLLGGLLATAPAGATDVGVSIGINQPGLYGRIDIGRFPQPQLIVQQPVLIYQQRHRPQPIYLHVPPGHRANWRLHCRAYNACATPVYFVQERWYQDRVVRGEPDRGERDARRGDRHDNRHDNRRADHWDNRHGERGPGRGHGRGHD